MHKAGRDIVLIVHPSDHARLKEMYPNNIKDLYGDIGICEFEFQIWNQICTFDYDYLREKAVEEEKKIENDRNYWIFIELYNGLKH